MIVENTDFISQNGIRSHFTQGKGILRQNAATTAAAHLYCTAAVAREHSAAFVLFQRQPASHPPTQNVSSADSLSLPAAQFSGNSAFLCNK